MRSGTRLRPGRSISNDSGRHQCGAGTVAQGSRTAHRRLYCRSGQRHDGSNAGHGTIRGGWTEDGRSLGGLRDDRHGNGLACGNLLHFARSCTCRASTAPGAQPHAAVLNIRYSDGLTSAAKKSQCIGQSIGSIPNTKVRCELLRTGWTLRRYHSFYSIIADPVLTLFMTSPMENFDDDNQQQFI